MAARTSLSVIALIGIAQGNYVYPHKDFVPDHIQAMADNLPDVSVDGSGKVSFAVDQRVLDKLNDEPRNYLRGSCIQTYTGYKDGTRMRDLKEMMGQETYDMVTEFTAFDFVVGECLWLQYWDCVESGWQFVPWADSGLFKTMADDYGYLILEILDWYGWWVEMMAQDGIDIYPDGIVAWKQEIVSQILSLKGLPVMVAQMPDYNEVQKGRKPKKSLEIKTNKEGKVIKPHLNDGGELIFDKENHEEIDYKQVESKTVEKIQGKVVQGRKDHVEGQKQKMHAAKSKNKLKAHVQPPTDDNNKKSKMSSHHHKKHAKSAARRRLLDARENNAQYGRGDDEDENPRCRHLNPAIFFGRRWSYVSRYLKSAHVADLDQKKDVDRPVGLITRLSFMAEACAGICVGIGVGFTWNSGDGGVSVHWIYGLGEHVPTKHKGNGNTPASVKMDLAVYCESMSGAQGEDVWQDTLTFGKVNQFNLEYNLIFDVNYNFLGISWTTGFGFDYIDAPSDEVNFFYLHAERFATYQIGGEDHCMTPSPTMMGEDGVGGGDDDGGDDADDDGDVPYGLGGDLAGCETAFAHALDPTPRCFLDIPEIKENRWGWAVDLVPFKTVKGNIIAAAGQCDLEKGTVVGKFQARLEGCDVTVTVDMDHATVIHELQVHISEYPYVMDDKGKVTVAPGAYDYVYSNIKDGIDYMFSVKYPNECNARYVLIHANVCNAPDVAKSDHLIKTHSEKMQEMKDVKKHRQAKGKFDKKAKAKTKKVQKQIKPKEKKVKNRQMDVAENVAAPNQRGVKSGNKGAHFTMYIVVLASIILLGGLFMLWRKWTKGTVATVAGDELKGLLSHRVDPVATTTTADDLL